MEILKYPHPSLFKKCKPVTVFGEELKILLDGMWNVMVASNGLGLAANQVGLDFRMFVMKGPNEERINLVNPYILKKSLAPANLKEGCLSAPGEFFNLKERAEWVQVSYENENGETQVRVFKGIFSVAFQHETDHLDGKSFLESKSIPKNKRKDLAKKWGLRT